MNILQLTHIFPYPLDDGGKISIYNLTKQFSLNGANVFFAGLQPYKPEPTDVDAILQWCKEAVFFPVERKYTLRSMVRNIFSPVPVNIHKYHSRSILDGMIRFASDKQIDIIHTDHLHMGYYGLALKQILGRPAVLRAHNLEMKIMQRFAEHQKNPLVRWYAAEQARKFQSYEPQTCASFDECLMITPEDEKTLRSMAPHVCSSVITAGVDVDFFSPDPVVRSNDTIAYIGNLEWWPNVHGLVEFVKNTFPILMQKRPTIKLLIYGRNPSEQIRRLHDGSNIIVRGFVNDIREAFRSSEIVIVPLYVGSGIRIKILEAMAMGKTIVTTSIGCEGIETHSRECFVKADSPTEFVYQICTLLDNPNRRNTLASNAHQVAKQYYSWSAIGSEFISRYESLISSCRKE